MAEDYRPPRVTFEITDEQRARLDKYLSTYGIRKAIFCKVLDDILDMVEDYGPVSVGILMSPTTRPRDILPSMKEAEVIKDGRSGRS